MAKKVTDLMKNVLVLITPQFNANRLIDQGRKIAEEVNGQLHVLYIKKGNSIFAQGHTAEILQNIYEYATKNDGIIHAACAEDIKEAMVDFVVEENITNIVMGESPMTKMLTKKDIASELRGDLLKRAYFADIFVVEKEEQDIYKAI